MTEWHCSHCGRLGSTIVTAHQDSHATGMYCSVECTRAADDYEKEHKAIVAACKRDLFELERDYDIERDEARLQWMREESE